MYTILVNLHCKGFIYYSPDVTGSVLLLLHASVYCPYTT